MSGEDVSGRGVPSLVMIRFLLRLEGDAGVGVGVGCFS